MNIASTATTMAVGRGTGSAPRRIPTPSPSCDQNADIDIYVVEVGETARQIELPNRENDHA